MSLEGTEWFQLDVTLVAEMEDTRYLGLFCVELMAQTVVHIGLVQMMQLEGRLK